VKKTVLIVGAGNLGRRHLQSLALCKQDIAISVVDPSTESLNLAKEVVEQSGLAGGASFHGSLDELHDEIDLVVVATTASGRLDILARLLDQGVKHFVLEKVAFNSMADINAARELLHDKHVGVWVNCPRRLYPVYKELKAKLADEQFKSFEVSGNRFGMACNGIHFIDLLAYLIDESTYEISAAGVDLIVESKRSGYVEFFGQMAGNFTSGCEVKLTCGNEDSDTGFDIHIELANGSLTINEINGSALLALEGKKEVIDFKSPYQSELTGPLVDAILTGQTCDLTSFRESMDLHAPFIQAAYNAYSAVFGENEKTYVPLT